MISLSNVENLEELDDFLVKLESLAKNYSFKDQLNGVVLEETARETYPLPDCNHECDEGYAKKRVVGPGGQVKCYCEKNS